MNVIKKTGNANAFVLPVVLILAAAFLATSLSTGTNEITGAAITGQQILSTGGSANKCRWFENSTGYPYSSYQKVSCPSSYPEIASGGCRTSDSIGISEPFLNGPGNSNGWSCANGFNSTTVTSIYKAYAYCCSK